jgi:hypothetical protein
MKRKAYQVVFSTALVVAFLSTIFLANANPSFAATGKEKSSTDSRVSAVEYTEAQIKTLQGALKITDPQKVLWNDLTQVMRENAKDMDAIHKDRAENSKTMNAVERLKLHSQITEAHLAQVTKLLPPFETFYVSLSDDQKKTTDTLFQTGRRGKNKKQ